MIMIPNRCKTFCRKNVERKMVSELQKDARNVFLLEDKRALEQEELSG